MTERPVLRDDRWGALSEGVDQKRRLSRLCYAASHVVLNDSYASIPHTPGAPGSAQEIAEHVDWRSTMELRSSIAATGMGIAEAMDTAQRFSLGWDSARELILRTGKLGVQFCAGASTDHLADVKTTEHVIDGVCEQIEVIREAGGIPVILPMPLLPALGTNADGYVEVYSDIVRNCSDGPLFVHWLGPMFLPSLDGYFPDDSFERVMRTDPSTVRGAKLSMLDASLEVRLRRELLQNDQIMLTGDDFHFGEMIAGSGTAERSTTVGDIEVQIGDFSHALLGIFDATFQPASLAIRLLNKGEHGSYDEIMSACELLGKCIFEEPTNFYKTGLAFISWLNGRQDNLMLVNHEESYRDKGHLLRVARLASEAGAISNAKTANERLSDWCATTA